MAAERIVLVGAGDHGRGVLEIVRALARGGAAVECAGFVDDRIEAREVDGVPCLGTVDWLLEELPELKAKLVLSMSSPEAKRSIAERLGRTGAEFAVLVHPRAEVSPSVRLGPGSVIGAGAVIVYESEVGAHVTVNLNATVGHHVGIGAFSTVAPGVNLLGRVAVGEGTLIHANAVVLPSVTVGDGAVVGAGSVVLRDVPPGTTVFGNPARPVPGTPSGSARS
jgi:sugar O-acyltransferase (sialic acid O-acetyltransferase NeuD family)